jgi:cytidylate kinase
MAEIESIYQVPVHGYRGESDDRADRCEPGGWTIAISREAGARGGTIARRVAELLNWQIFSQESIDYMLQQQDARMQLESELSADNWQWLQLQRQRLRQKCWPMEETRELVDLLLLIAARGNAVVVGRGAGFLLPATSTLHVRIVAPFAERVTWMAQLLRLTQEEAEQEVQARDQRRQRFLHKMLGAEAIDPYAYDAILNSGRLGIEACVHILAGMIRSRQAIAAELQQRLDYLQDSGFWNRA